MNFKKHSGYRKLILGTLVVWMIALKMAADGVITSDVATMINAVAILLLAPAIAGTITVCCAMGSQLMPKFRGIFTNAGLLCGQFAITIDKIMCFIPGNPYGAACTAHMWELGLILCLKEQNVEAAQVLSECLKRVEKEEGPESEGVLSVLSLLVGAQRNVGDFEESLKSGQRAVTMLEKQGPTGYCDAATIYADLCVTYSQQGRIKEAIEFGEKAKALLFDLTNEDMPYGKEGLIAISMNNLACVYDDACQFDRAFELYKRALDLKNRSLPPEDPSIGVAHCNMSYILGVMEKYEESLQHAKISQKMLEDAKETNTRHWADTMRNMGSAERGLGNLEAAEKYLLEGKKYYDANVAKSVPAVGDYEREMAKLYREKGEVSKSRDYFHKAISIYENSMGKEHPQTIRTLREYLKLLENGQWPPDSSEVKSVKERIAAADAREEREAVFNAEPTAVASQEQGDK